MPATYHLVPGNIWDRHFRRLSLEAKVVAFNVWTSPLRSSEGLFGLSTAHIAADTALSGQQVDTALVELEQAGVLHYDFDAELVFDPGGLKASPLKHAREADGSVALRKDGSPKLDKRVEPAVRKFRQLPQSPLKQAFLRHARQLSPDLAEALDEGSPDPQEPPTQPPSEGARQAPGEPPIRARAEQEREYEGELSVERCEVCGESLSPDWCTCTQEARIRQQTQQMQRAAQTGALS